MNLGVVHKRHSQSGGGGVCSVRTFFGQGGEGGSLDADVRTFWCKTLRIFRNLWCVRTDRGGGRVNADILRTRGGIIFRDFVRAFFMDGPLTHKF